MTRRRWIADEESGDTAALTGANAAHLARVLRARVGQEFDVAAGERVRRGTVTAITDDRVEFALGEEVPAASAVPITLYLSVFKFDRFEWAVEKCTELGVARIVPVIARRTETHLASAAGKRVERWRRVALEAAQQSRRVAAPAIDDPAPLKKIVSDAAGLRIVLAETERQSMLRDLINDDPVSLAIGPEGGWSEDELAMFDAAGWQSASLGGTILRAETAAIAVVSVVALG
jgi:16S rRNA (uracil1498-N3)-methyltransferase